jgi:hypothetical protein
MLESNEAAVESNEASQHNKHTTEWTISIFSPIALSFAYFSMPPAVIPFELNVKHFLISTVIFLIIVRLLFYIFGGQLHKTRLWKGIAARTKLTGLDRSIATHICSALECFSYCLLSILPRRYISRDRPIADIELGNVDGAGV